MSWNKTTRMLLPIFDFRKNMWESIGMLYEHGFENVYLDKQFKTKSCLFFVFSPKQINDKFKKFDRWMRSTPFYNHAMYKHGKIVYILDFPKEYIDSVYIPFINSRYSKMHPGYIDTKFTKFCKKDGKVIVCDTWKVLHKDNTLKVNIERDFGVKLSENDECEGLLVLEQEVYDYSRISKKV